MPEQALTLRQLVNAVAHARDIGHAEALTLVQRTLSATSARLSAAAVSRETERAEFAGRLAAERNIPIADARRLADRALDLASSDSDELVQRTAAARRVTPDAARETIARNLTSATKERDGERVLSLRAAAKDHAARAGISIELAQSIIDDRRRRRGSQE